MTYSGKWFALGLYFEWNPVQVGQDPFTFDGGPIYIRLGRFDIDKEQ